MASLQEGEIILNPSPSDGVASVRFAPSTNALLAACWDSQMRFYDTNSNSLLQSFALGVCLSGSRNHALRNLSSHLTGSWVGWLLS